jgi:hypothetical protein
VSPNGREPQTPRGLAPTAWEFLAVALAFVAATLILTLPLAVHPTRTLPSDLTDTLLNTWIIGWDADRLRHGLFGVWNAPIFHPYRYTLAFSENLFGIAFFVAPVYWASGNPVLTYNIGFFCSFALAGIGMYLLVRALTGDRAAAAVAGAFFAFCPFRLAQIAHVQMVATGWIPMALWGLHRYFATRRRGWLAVFGVGWVLQALSNLYVFYFLAVPACIVMAEGLMRDRGHRCRQISELSAACLVVAALMAPVAHAYYRVRLDYQQVRSADEIANGGADVRSYLVGKNSIGIWRWLPTAVTTDPERELFPGVAAVLLVGFAFRRVGDSHEPLRRWTRLYGLIAVVALALSLGPHIRIWGWVVTAHGPYDWLLRIVPGMDGMRVPARFAIVFFVALSVLAGCGASLALARMTPPRRGVALTLCLAAIVAESWAVPLPLYRYVPGGRPEDRAVAEWLRQGPPGAVLHLPVVTDDVQELHYQYATLFHGHPLVNGFSGYTPRLLEVLRGPSSPLYDYARFPATVRMLRSLGVKYVIVHLSAYRQASPSNPDVEQTVAALRDSRQVAREQRLLDVVAFELNAWHDPPAPEAALVAIESHELALSVSESQERLPYLVDRDPDSRWIGGQEGSSWVAARFARPYDVARVELQLAERTLDDYPRALRIEGLDADGRSTVLYEAVPFSEFAAAIVRNGRYPNLVITLPRNNTLQIFVRETARSRKPWSVHEVRLWRRP